MRSVVSFAAMITAGAMIFGPTMAPVEAATLSPPPLLGSPEAQAVRLKSLNSRTDDMLLSGEVATRLIPVIFTAAEAARAQTFTLAFDNAISVMPEASRITVKINEVVIGETSVDAAGQTRSVTFPVPLGLLRAGTNALRISTRHAHRVDCSMAATYELWTRLDRARTGFPIAGVMPGPASLAELGAFPPGADGRIQLRLLMPSGVDGDTVARWSRAVQSLLMVSDIRNVALTIGDADLEGPVIDLAVGSLNQLAVLDLSVPVLPGVSVQRKSDGEGLVVSLAAETPEAVDRLIDNLATGGSVVPGSPEGKLAIATTSGVRIAGNTTVSLRDLGAETHVFSGRHYRQVVRTTLPADFYPGDYGRVRVKIDAAYSAGLKPDSDLRLHVNGAPVATVKLGRSGGGTLRQQEVDIPLRVFKPGQNVIEVVASTRLPSEDRCEDPALLGQHDRLVMSNTTELQFPAFARAASLPHVSAVMGGLTSKLSQRPTIYLPGATNETVAATMGLLARISTQSGEVVPARFSFTRPPVSSEHAIVVAPLADIPETALSAAGLERTALLRGWTEPSRPLTPTSEPPTASNDAAAPRVRLAASGGIPLLPAASVAAPQSPDPVSRIIADWQTTRDGELIKASAVSDWMHDILAALGNHPVVTELLAVIPTSADAKPFGAGAGDAIVIAQGAREARVKEGPVPSLLPELASMTVIAAPDQARLVSGLQALTAANVWSDFSSGASAYNPETGRVTTTDAANAHLVATSAMTFGNARLVLAGWLSANILTYVGLLLGAGLFLALVTAIVVRRTGVRA